MSPFDIGVFAVGWTLGWLLLWRGRPLPVVAALPTGSPTSRGSGRSGASRDAIAVIVPARDEADAMSVLIPALRAQLQEGDELLVVDDHSSDSTASTARACGATVVQAPELRAGWLGKPNACWAGSAATSAPTLLFVDADVAPAPDLLDRIDAVITRHPGEVVSVQPWHRMVRLGEQASALCNVAALMGSGAFTIAGARVRPTVAFGPVLAIRREVYEAIGGHAAVRGMHTEDIGLARAVGEATLFTGRPDTSFRMYPRGFRQLFDGWTRSIATGARSTPLWCSVATAAWMTAIAGGWLAGGWPTSDPVAFLVVYASSALQIWVLGRLAGSIHPLTAMLYPCAVVVFLAIVVRSALAIAFGREVTWKGRRVAARGDR